MCFYDNVETNLFPPWYTRFAHLKKMSKVSGTLLTMNFAPYISSRGTLS